MVCVPCSALLRLLRQCSLLRQSECFQKLKSYFRFWGILVISVIVFYILNLALNLLVISAIFAVIFKVLPDANIRWRDVAWGAVVTALLFMVGKVGISIYIAKTDVGGAFGATGSLVVLLLWTYYSSIILYFGAAFTRGYAIASGSKIYPNKYAVWVEEVEVQTNKNLQDTRLEKERVEADNKAHRE
ncbi:MAG: YihY/virulence factor BrkB family protein [Chitinophagaceae bacterium]|nr:MAG: YihY/virulence factor BrkB family protein [Chitinophagaceae bacterium]